FRRRDELAATQAKRLATNDPTVLDPALGHQREDQVLEALAQVGQDRNGQEESGKGPDHLDELLDQEVDLAAEVARDSPERHADGAGDDHDGEGNDERYASAEEQATEDVAAQVVGPQE